jgi:tripartite-type tricarboxylate transporter receptor subunit TctC
VRAGTPAPLVAQLGEDLRTTMARPDARARLDQIGTPFTPIFGVDVAQFIAREQNLWWPIVKEAAAR